MPSQMQALAAWLMTYALHSTLLLGAAWLIVRSRRVSPAAADITWKIALVGGLITATAQGVLAVRPTGSFAFTPPAASTGSTHAPANDPDLITIEADITSGAAVSRAPVTGDAAPPAEGVAPGPTTRLPSLPALLATAWLAVAAILVGGYAARRLVLVGRLGDRRLVGDERVTDLLDTLRLETGVATPIRLTTSRSISSPVALDGEICLPTAVVEELEPDQQRAMLAHELAHIVRRDPMWLVAACVVERAFFFQPLNRLARRGIQVSAEYLADEWAARRTGGVPLARALVKVAEWIQASPLGVPVAGFAEERSQLTVRVSRLLDRTAWATSRSRWAAGAIAAAMLVLTTAFAPGVSRLAAVEPLGTPDSDGLAQDGSAAQDDGLQQGGDTSVVAAVIARLRDEDEDVRQAAANALGRLKHRSAIQPLVRALEDESTEVRRAALDALGEYERGVPAAPIRRLLSHEDPEFRSEAAHMLGHLKDRASIPAIAALLVDVSDDVRYHALEALDEMEAPIEEGTVGRSLEDSSPEIRQAAAELAGDRRMTSLVPTLIRMLEDTSGEVRESAAEALTEMRTEASHRALRMALTHRDARVRKIAVEYLGDDDR